MAFLFLINIVVFLSYLKLIVSKGFVPFPEPIQDHVISPPPHTYLKENDLPLNFDWRNINGTNFGSKVLTQQSPSVCGSCWAEAATGALSDRYAIATLGKLRINLAPQQLLNFNSRITGGSCNGGDDLKAYDFIHKYGIADDTCAPFVGLNWLHGFDVAAKTDVEDVRSKQCYVCTWGGNCGFIPRASYNLYGADEFGIVRGEFQMKAEIFARGPIACSINSDATQFNLYRGGIISCDIEKEKECATAGTDHVIVVAGWGEDAQGNPFWIGRNSYGTQWGEGAGGGWFRLERGKNTLNLESYRCSWATPATADVTRALQQYRDSTIA